MTNGHKHRFWTDDPSPFQEERRRAQDPRPRRHPILNAIGFVLGIGGILACLWLLVALLSIIFDD